MIKILTDSSSDLEADDLKKMDIISVPLSVTFDEDTYKDGVDLSKPVFYEKLKEAHKIPKTAQPAPELFLEHFEKAKQCGDSVVAVMLSSGLSGTYQSACIARDMCGYENIYIVDSKSAVAGIRILLDMAVKMRSEDKTAPEIAEACESVKSRVKILTAVDTLEYLHMGGRLTSAQFALGNLANLKPVVSLNEEGKIYVTDKCLGRTLTCRRMLDHLKTDGVDENHKIYYLCFNIEKTTEKLIDTVVPYFPDATRENMTYVGPTIASHVGAGAFGVVYVTKN